MKRAALLLFLAVLLTLALSDAKACEPPTRFAFTVPGPGGSYGVVEYESDDPSRPEWLNYETYFMFGQHCLRVPLPAPVMGCLSLGAIVGCAIGLGAGRRAKIPFIAPS